MKSAHLNVGAQGAGVNRLHYLLRDIGYEIDENDLTAGFFGLSTRSAVMAFQAHSGMSETGLVDDSLWGALTAHRPADHERRPMKTLDTFASSSAGIAERKVDSPATVSSSVAKQVAAVLHRYTFKDAFQQESTTTYLELELTAAQKAIDRKFVTLSFYANGGLTPGAPAGEVQYAGSSGLGFLQPYQVGIIYWRRDLGAFWVHGAILAKYLQLGGESSFLGFPLSDEFAASDLVGRFSNFENGSIIWHPSVGAFEIHGAIRDKWRASGGVSLGYPTTDETGIGDAAGGRFNHFRDLTADVDVSIYFTQSTGAHVVHGVIRRRWAELGWERSFLGYPTGDLEGWTESDTGNTGLMTRFQRGSILWKAEDQSIIEVPAQFTIDSGHVGVSSVGGTVQLTLTSAGAFTYQGHFHNSGLVGLGGTVASAVRIGFTTVGKMAKKNIYMGGSLSFSDRNDDFSESGFDDKIRENWDDLVQSHPMSTQINIDSTDPEALFVLVFLPLLALGSLSLLAFKSDPPDTRCKEGGGLHTVKDGNNNTVVEPGWTSCGSWY